MTLFLAQPADIVDRNKPFMWQHPFLNWLHLGSFRMADEADVDLGVLHNNYHATATVSEWLASTGVKVECKKTDVPGRFRIRVLKADNTLATSSPATVTGGAGPFAITPGQTTKFSVNGGATQTKTWAGTRSSVTSSGATYASLDTKTLQVKINGGGTQTVTFTATEGDRATTIAKLQSDLSGEIIAAGSGNEIVYSSARYGTGSVIEIVGGTALAALGLTTGVAPAGTGDAFDLGATTRTEAAAALELAITGAAFSGAGSALVASTDTSGATSTIEADPDGDATQGLSFAADEFSGTGSDVIVSFEAKTTYDVPRP